MITVKTIRDITFWLSNFNLFHSAAQDFFKDILSQAQQQNGEWNIDIIALEYAFALCWASKGAIEVLRF